MTGPYDGVIGVQKELIVQSFLTNMPSRFEPAVDDVRLCATLIDCDAETGRATAVQRIMLARNRQSAIGQDSTDSGFEKRTQSMKSLVPYLSSTNCE